MFTITRSGDTSGVSTVDFSTANGSASSSSDYVARSGTLTFTAGQTSKTVTVQVKGDLQIESNETFKLNLFNASGANITNSQGIGTIVDDDAAKPKLSVAGISLVEGNSGTKAFQFKVTLNKASTTPITVKFATSNGTASSASDYNATSGMLTFAANETVKIVTVLVKGDKTKELDETFFVNLSNATNATISVAKGTGTIRNDD